MIRHARAIALRVLVWACAFFTVPRSYAGDAAASDPVEGLWQMSPTGGGAVFELQACPGQRGVFELRMIESPDWRIPPGTVCGRVMAAARPGVYECVMDAAPGAKKKSLKGAYTATLELDDTGHRLLFKPYSRHRRVSLHRWLPYFFRVTLERENPRPSDLEGAVRISHDGRSAVEPVEL
ncbi:MAG: hypothetical protein K2L96_00550 [Muribaculaceae bacterium]|nr:hypothetical protein [Muribaculaceae bacterium]